MGNVSFPVMIGDVQKNSRELVRVSLTEFKGYKLVDVRIYAGADDDAKPTGKGISVKASTLPALIVLLQKAEAQARTMGLIDGGAQ
ncbi:MULTISPECIES: transcriptional coactivator p15/PC4 family protein [Asticcacaulis]|uniref:transcriptional coactivator p15/PC4 family protein n=1 Tax=Asticcacaulis TaxID=76890 RepID=UPI001AE43879|nr:MULTISPECIES: transcriptional coactivator p15/PC4 family protein [Asticcacaulis]MBP2159544.1 hypothetical protein [Asticcacaulis solisilvae]MDR6800629.1 hypothetical protein [Asticcacaulis sp. BE141]